jgi:hypothetical protein
MNDHVKSNDETNMVNMEMMRSVFSMQRGLAKKTKEMMQIIQKNGRMQDEGKENLRTPFDFSLQDVC